MRALVSNGLEISEAQPNKDLNHPGKGLRWPPTAEGNGLTSAKATAIAAAPDEQNMRLKPLRQGFFA